MKNLLVTLLAGCATAFCTAATPLWMRDVRISPDGREIVFCYKGDIYKVATEGGLATQLTTQDTYECFPCWSPDGKRIAFASDRYGNFDVFVMSSAGGRATRLTTHSTPEVPSTFTPDGDYVVFSASIQDPATSALFPTTAMTELYRVPATGGRTEQILGTPAEAVCYSARGDRFLYQDKKGFEDTWRKHHTSSITRDVWLYDAEKGTHRNLTSREGEDRNPVLSPDEETVYFLSERDGSSFNVFSFPIADPQSVTQVSHFQTHPVRFLSISRDGLLCYAYDGEIYTQRPDASPRKVAIDIIRDDHPQVEKITVSDGATSATVSSDGKQVAFTVRGEVFVTSADYATTKQVTHTPAREAGLSFSPDCRTLAYASERTGRWQLYLARIVRREDPNFSNATLIEEECLLPSDEVERAYPQFSPDGKELAFIENRNCLMVYNLDTRQTRRITDGSLWYNTSGQFDYVWSPDGRWFALEFIGNRHDPYSDIGLVSAAGGGEIVNVTNSGYMADSPQFVLDGNAILFSTDRYGMRSHASWGSQRDAMIVFLNQDSYDRYCLSKEDYELRKELDKDSAAKTKASTKKKNEKQEPEESAEKPAQKPITVELRNLQDRIVRLTPSSANIGCALISHNGEDLYYTVSTAQKTDLWKMDLRSKETKHLKGMERGWSTMQLDKGGAHLFLFGSRGLHKMDTKSEAMTSISFKTDMRMDLAAEREYMFDHVYIQERERFYDKGMHGVDWEAMTKAYRKFLPHIDNNYDFAELLGEWLGELNVSHTGGRIHPKGQSEPTASLGLLFSWAYRGEGMLVEEVLEKGPFDRADTRMKAGIVVEKIDGTPISPEQEYYYLLNNKARKKTLVSLYDPQTGERWDEVVIPVTGAVKTSLLYDRWVRRRAADVERWSGGRLGYVHIKEMADDSFRSMYSDILGRYNNCEGIVIDTRFNGGGRLHEDVEVLFSGNKYFTQVIRGREACDMPSRRWNKPSIMLMCEANYSNAHGTPWVYRHQRIGKLVGMPVPGTMTSVSWERLQDETLVFGIPVTGYRLPDGTYLENTELQPDIRVLNAPEDVVKGEDTQLRVAVEELLKQIDGK